MSVNLSIPSLNSCVHCINEFPCISSTFAVIHSDVIVSALEQTADTFLGISLESWLQPKGVYSQEETKNINIIKASAKSIITYLALRTLASLSLCVNGSIGLGEIAFGLKEGLINKPGSVKYQFGQALLKDGVSRLITGVADFCLGNYQLIAAALSCSHGFKPKETQFLIDNTFVWKNSSNQNLTYRERDFAIDNSSWIALAADRVQQHILPNPSMRSD